MKKKREKNEKINVRENERKTGEKEGKERGKEKFPLTLLEVVLKRLTTESFCVLPFLPSLKVRVPWGLVDGMV